MIMDARFPVGLPIGPMIAAELVERLELADNLIGVAGRWWQNAPLSPLDHCTLE
jgi:hypothetical protein